MTRAKLNALYGCRGYQMPVMPPTPVTTPPVVSYPPAPVTTNDTSFQIYPLKMDNNGPAFAGHSYTVAWKSGSANTNQLIYCGVGSVNAAKGDGAYQLGSTYLSNGQLTFTMPALSSANYLISCGSQTSSLYANSPIFAVQAADASTPNITVFGAKDPNPTTGSVVIIWQASGATQASIDVSCTPGSISFTTDKGNAPTCEKGGVWWWQNPTSAESITVTPVGNTQSITIPFTLTLMNNGAPVPGKKQTIYVSFPVPAPTIDSFSINDSEQFSISANNFSTITFKADCGSFVHIYNAYGATSSAYPIGINSLCSAEQPYSISTSNMSQNISNEPIILWGMQGISYIGNGPTTNNSGPVTITAKACNIAGMCFQKSVTLTVYARG